MRKWMAGVWERFAYAYQRRAKYLRPGRLEEILMLIQVLGLDERTRISANKLAEIFQASEAGEKLPQSADDWAELARDHREFFRVVGKNHDEISLVARHAAKAGEGQARFDDDFVQTLMKMAIDIYDRSLQQSRRLTLLIAVLTTLATALGAIVQRLVEGKFSSL